ncbi:unnamed protein product [Paramecium octaurelia]|uniref:Uncharacterized protein n=1 Tax=Paramecium octaurelia TaxID=43137 RepID=A0A8S1TS51_PAROT|nr:unnamed protein product [Paramecium octaurelia]
MYQKILNLIYPQSYDTQQQTQAEVPKRSQKLSQMTSLINMNEFFQYPEKLIQDATSIMNEFCNDNIDIYIQDESILRISGFVNILIKQKSFQIVMNFSFFLNYPQQIFNICIENKSLDDKDIKLSSFFHSSQGEKWISLNSYLTEAKLWLNHQNLQRVFQEAKELLTNHFPYHKQKKQQQYFSNDPIQIDKLRQSDQKDSNEEITDKIEIDKQVKDVVNKNAVTSPNPLNSQAVLGPSGLQLKQENQIQMQISKFAIQLMKEHRNDIANLKEQYQNLKLYKQQQEGIQNQLIWLRQKLDFDIDLAASFFYMQQQQISQIDKIQQKPLDEIMDFDDLSQQIIEIVAKDKACSDCYQFISKKFKRQLLDYATLQRTSWQASSLNQNY